MTSVHDAPELDPRRMLIFREVARRGSLSAAAVALGWTQPAVGQHVQRLERDVGLPLALRTSRGVTLTEAGELLLAHADALASRLAAAGEQMRALRTLRSGRLRLAAFPSACAMLVPTALAQLAEVAPGLEVRLTELEPPEAREAVLCGDIDLALTFRHGGDGEASPDLIDVPLLDDPVRVVLPAGHRLVGDGGTAVSLAALAREHWVAGCPRCRTHLIALAAAAGFVPDIRHETDDYVVVQNLVGAGLAVALLPRLALGAAPNPAVTTAGLVGNPSRRVSLLHRRESGALPAVQEVVRILRSHVATLVDGSGSSTYADAMTGSSTLIDSGTSRDPAVGLRAVAALRRLTDRLEDLQVQNARDLGWSWADIAEAIGVSKQAVHKKHAGRVARGATRG